MWIHGTSKTLLSTVQYKYSCRHVVVVCRSQQAGREYAMRDSDEQKVAVTYRDSRFPCDRERARGTRAEKQAKLSSRDEERRGAGEEQQLERERDRERA